MFPTWARWARTLDSALLGGRQSTFLAVSVLDNRAVGDSRAYLWDPRRGDVVLLLTDGAWTPLSLHGLQRLVAGAALGGFAELPGGILDAAGRSGRADDMTAVVARLRG